MAGSLKEFLNHGILPFVGRVDEADRLFRFWLDTVETNTLCAGLLLGEAGIGKSRLIEEVTARIMHAGGAVVHVKLYPESTVSIIPLIAKALRLSGNRRRGTQEAGGTMTAVTDDLRRLTHLRPTLLIIEDIHLLSDDAVGEIGLLLENLADDVLTVLFVARPVDLPVRSVIAPYVRTELQLQGLLPEHVATLLDRLFALPRETDVVRLLMNAAHGNPLALRSAIRAALHSGALRLDEANNRWRVTFPLPSLSQTVKQNVAVLSEGMMSHLTEGERRAAERLACLGEVFAREAAEAAVEDADTMLEALSSKGVIGPSITSASALPGGASGTQVLAFTHTILHIHLAERAALDVPTLIGLIAGNAPLYSVLPFQIIARNGHAFTVSADEARRAIRRSINVAGALNESQDWRLAVDACNAGMAIHRGDSTQWSAEEARLLSVRLLCCRMELLRRIEDANEYRTQCNALLELVEADDSPTLLPYRLRALAYRHVLGRRTDPSLCLQTWERARELIGAHPELRCTDEYIDYLEAAARSMLYMAHDEMVRVIEAELNLCSTETEISPERSLRIRQIVAFHFLDIFETPEELAKRIAMLEQFEEIDESPRLANFLISKLTFLYTIGALDACLQCAERATPMARHLGLTSNYYIGALTRQCALAAIGADLDTVESEIIALGSTVRDAVPHFEVFAHLGICETALFRGASDWLAARFERYAHNAQYLREEARWLLAFEEPTRPNARPDAVTMSRPKLQRAVELMVAAESAGSDAPTTATLVDAFTSAMRAPLLRLFDLLERRLLLAMVMRLRDSERYRGLPEQLAPEIGSMMIETLDWLRARRISAYIAPFLERYGMFLPDDELQRRRAEAVEIGAERSAELLGSTQRARARKRITMIGAVQLLPLQGRPIPIRGARLRTLLGLMIAGAMKGSPLSHQEFSTIVSGSEDPDKARKTLNGVVFRLRDLLGHDAVNTDGETPTLDLDLMEVDLVDAQRDLVDAWAAQREGSLVRAQRRLRAVLDLTRGQVAFPSLYDDYFERIRVEFESSLRTLLLKVAHGLLAQSDAEKAEELLRIGFAAMAEDDEIAELLCRTLETRGKRTEAERVRMRLSDLSE